jgi:mRNA interferase RelE/StbE
MTFPSAHAILTRILVYCLFQNLHPGLKRKVRDALEQILVDPHSGKALKDELEGLRSFRVGRFRIVYRIATVRRIDLVAVGPRAIIYEETHRRIAKTLRPSGEQMRVIRRNSLRSLRPTCSGIA